MFAYVRESDGALVVAAGIPRAWLTETGVSARNLPTPYGQLSLHVGRRGAGLAVDLDGDARPPGGIRVAPLLAGPAGTVLVNGVRAEPGPGGEILVRELPARIEIQP
jgi:hypothetical protein